jgi:hypothetical protein
MKVWRTLAPAIVPALLLMPGHSAGAFQRPCHEEGGYACRCAYNRDRVSGLEESRHRSRVKWLEEQLAGARDMLARTRPDTPQTRTILLTQIIEGRTQELKDEYTLHTCLTTKIAEGCPPEWERTCWERLPLEREQALRRPEIPPNQLPALVQPMRGQLLGVPEGCAAVEDQLFSVRRTLIDGDTAHVPGWGTARPGERIDRDRQKYGPCQCVKEAALDLLAEADSILSAACRNIANPSAPLSPRDGEQIAKRVQAAYDLIFPIADCVQAITSANTPYSGGR